MEMVKFLKTIEKNFKFLGFFKPSPTLYVNYKEIKISKFFSFFFENHPPHAMLVTK